MDNKEAIIQATIKLIEEKGEHLEEVTVREICKRATYTAYLPLVAACRPDLDEAAIKRKTLYLITVMQQTFLRYEIISQTLGIDLRQKENRRNFHTQVLHDILEV